MVIHAIENVLTIPLPHIHTWAGDEKDIEESLKGKGVVIIHVDAAKMSTIDDLLQTLQAAYKFPDYFGDNINALNDCITDLSWLDFDQLVTVVKNGDELLKLPEIADLFYKTMRDAGVYWAIPRGEEDWDKSKSFHTVVCAKDQMATRHIVDIVGYLYAMWLPRNSPS